MIDYSRPSCHPAVLLKIYICCYLSPLQSSGRLGCERQCKFELMWLTGRLAPDFKTIGGFRRDNGTGTRDVCRRFAVLYRQLKICTVCFELSGEENGVRLLFAWTEEACLSAAMK